MLRTSNYSVHGIVAPSADRHKTSVLMNRSEHLPRSRARVEFASSVVVAREWPVSAPLARCRALARSPLSEPTTHTHLGRRELASCPVRDLCVGLSQCRTISESTRSHSEARDGRTEVGARVPGGYRSSVCVARIGNSSNAAISPRVPPISVSQARAASKGIECSPLAASVAINAKAKAPQAMS
jgi:hypothetical protein